MTVFEKIEEQQERCKDTQAFYVGEHIKEICRESTEIAEIVLQDLSNPELSIIKAEAKIAAYAREHGSKKFGFCPPQEADRILREFYGLPSRAVSPAPQKAKIVNLLDLL